MNVGPPFRGPMCISQQLHRSLIGDCLVNLRFSTNDRTNLMVTLSFSQIKKTADINLLAGCVSTAFCKE